MLVTNDEAEIYLGSMLIYTSVQMVGVTCKSTIYGNPRIEFPGTILLSESIWIMLTEVTMVSMEKLP